MKITTGVLLALLIGSPVLAQSTQLGGATPETACECFDKGFFFGTYNYTPQNSGQSENMQFKCGLKGFRQAFDEGLYEGFKDYLVARGDYSQGYGSGLCPYSDY